jgi:hypothetical protein
MAEPQSFQSHTRYVPGYHFLLGTILLVNLIWRLVVLIGHPGWGAGNDLLLSFGLILMYNYLRSFPLKVQDRIIRLEERLRMERLLPAEFKPRIGEFTRGQLVALRFASDGELPALARRVLDERILDKKQIKQLIQQWRSDEARA